jgi:peptidoglycan/xylan/chitin deacetylase (PgdA/CDA1 family)
MLGRVLTVFLYGAGLCLYYVGAAPLVRRLGRRNPKILLYHDCAEEESDYLADLECTTSPRTFRNHIDYLSKHYRIVPLETLLSGDAPPGAVSITFDDGYASVYRNAFPVLKDNGAPATIYLISSVVNNAALVWVNELNCLARRGGPDAVTCIGRHFDVAPEASAAEIISTCRLNYSGPKMQALLAELREITGLRAAEHAREAQLYLTWDEIHEMRAYGIEFGNHSRTHPNMERLTEEEQLAEIEGAQKDLNEHLPYVRAFAHPFGHHGSTTSRIASGVGLSSAADVGGYNRPVQALSLGRTHMANEGVPGLFARMEVVEPSRERSAGACNDLDRRALPWLSNSILPFAQESRLLKRRSANVPNVDSRQLAILLSYSGVFVIDAVDGARTRTRDVPHMSANCGVTANIREY